MQDPNSFRPDIAPQQFAVPPSVAFGGCLWAFLKTAFFLTSWGVVVAAAIKYLWRG